MTVVRLVVYHENPGLFSVVFNNARECQGLLPHGPEEITVLLLMISISGGNTTSRIRLEKRNVFQLQYAGTHGVAIFFSIDKVPVTSKQSPLPAGRLLFLCQQLSFRNEGSTQDVGMIPAKARDGARRELEVGCFMINSITR